jgi:hypothetical protein
MADTLGRERADQLVEAWDDEAYHRGIGKSLSAPRAD